MKFTDKDLAQLKFALFHKCDLPEEIHKPFNGSPHEKTKALLLRLEAAENLAKKHWHKKGWSCEYCRTWQTISGKSSTTDSGEKEESCDRRGIDGNLT